MNTINKRVKRTALVILGIIGGAVALVCFAAMATVVGMAYYWSIDPEGIAVKVKQEGAPRVGQEFSIIITVKNERADQPVHIREIGFDGRYMQKFEIAEADERAFSNGQDGLFHDKMFACQLDIPPGGEEQLRFRLRAVESGPASGYLRVWEGDRSVAVRLRNYIPSS